MSILSPETPAIWLRLNPKAFWGELKARYWLGLLLLAISIAGAIAYLHVATYKYTAELLVVPSEQSDPSLPSSMAGLGSLVGLDISQNNMSFTMYADALSTRQVAETISKDSRIMRALFPAQWDEAVGGWREPSDLLRSMVRCVRTVLGVPVKPWREPGAADVQRYVVKHVKFVEEKRRPVAHISYEHEDPAFASYFLSRLTGQADTFLREQSITRTSAYISYLERRMQDVTIAEQRQSLAQLISSYEKARMMASSGTSFAADHFGEVNISPEPTSPPVPIVLGLAIAAGLLFWLVATALLALRRMG